MNVEVKICAAGDVSFYGSHSETPSFKTFSSVASEFKAADLTIVNLEHPLIEIGAGTSVKGKCTLRASTGWADVLKEAGVNLVSLANNHMMDYGEEGLVSTMSAIEKAGLAYVGAGKNRIEANKPLLLTIHGKKVAILARSSVIVSSPSYASENTAGIAFLDIEETIKTIRECSTLSACVILLIHWGIEQYKYPTLDQRRLASKFAGAGINIILGHHSHVLQGIERMGSALVAYSLGNFLFDEFTYEINTPHGFSDSHFRLSKENREGIILTISITDKNVSSFKPTFSIIGENGEILLDQDHSRVPNFDTLCKRLTWPLYEGWWKLYSLKREWNLRIKPKVFPKGFLRKLLKVRPQHFFELLNSIKRSSKITSGKSTNPYE
jgi:hypothetical protein